jgi:hypothetical protein
LIIYFRRFCDDSKAAPKTDELVETCVLRQHCWAGIAVAMFIEPDLSGRHGFINEMQNQLDSDWLLKVIPKKQKQASIKPLRILPITA